MQQQTSTITLYNYGVTTPRSYLLAAAFIVGNIVLPQLCHLMPQGGLILLPIYFFTLLGAYKYGLTVGLLTAVLSPLANNLLFGMPPAPMLPIILIKSTILAMSAALIARRTGRATLLGIVLAVITYQALGSLAEWGMTGSLAIAMQDISLGWPGILLQVLGCYLLLRYPLRK